MMSRLLVVLACVLHIGAGYAATGASPAPASLTFGVVPQQSASTLAQLWTPILQYLSKQTGYSLPFKTAPDIPEFERRLAAGEYDLAYMNPYHYTVFHRSPGYQAFAKEKDRRIQGILVVRKDSPYQRPEDLAGQTLVFPAPAAFAASVLPRVSLTRQGIAFTAKYVASHDSVYLAVAKGLYPAGGGIKRTFDTIAPETRDQLRILWTTDAYTPHAIAAHPRVPAAVVRKVQEAMTAMHQDPQGRALLEASGFQGIAPAQDAEWDDIRALGITELDQPTPNSP
jgi:phosphonate transport system substrate-binding protein